MKIVGSITTLPSRLPEISTVIIHILQQTVPLDVLYLNIPYKTKTGLRYNIPPNFTRAFSGYTTTVVINRCLDYGPITKICPVLDIETDPETIIFSFDDDIIVGRTLVKTLLSKSRRYKRHAIGLNGFCIGTNLFPFQLALNNTEDVEVDVLQGVHVILYRRSFFKTCDELVFYWKNTPINKELLRNDDHHISAYLAEKNIKRISVGINAKDLVFKHTEKQIDALSLDFNSLYKEHKKIISYFKERGLYHLSYTVFQSPMFVIFLLALSVAITILSIFYRKLHYLVFIVMILALIASEKEKHTLDWPEKRCVPLQTR